MRALPMRANRRTVTSGVVAATPHAGARPARQTRATPLVLAMVITALAAGCRTAVDPVAIADAQLAARVKTALVNDQAIGALPIEVRVDRGVAVLSGRVPSMGAAARAPEIARGVPGVTSVRSLLVVGTDPTPESSTGPVARDLQDVELEFDPPPSFLAVGASLGWSIPRPEALKSRASVGPLIKVGTPGGLGPAIGFDWFHADMESLGGAATLTRVHVRPIMGGVGYTWSRGRLSLTPSFVGGYAFNSLTVTDIGMATGLPVEVDNSLAWRAGGSLWYDLSRRLTLNVSSGYLMTNLRLTVLQGGRLQERDQSANTTLVRAGVAYRVF